MQDFSGSKIFLCVVVAPLLCGTAEALAERDMMAGMLGQHSMMREGSGTSWQPEATPMLGTMWQSGDWSLMAHGMVNAIYDDQGGRRGDSKSVVTSMGMLMASTELGAGVFGLRGMFSLDPLMGRSGYPLLLQTGETADGEHHLVDRQHPHDAFMELAATYSVPLANGDAVYGYLGLPGEPALGPSAFMHRFSGADNPEAPLTHHWLDSTHITFGVATLGYALARWKIEGSLFNGREPDQYRWNIETRAFDSASARLSFNPNDAWALQVSHGYLDSPEQLEPEVSVRRTTASASYQSRAGGGQWQSTLAWGLNAKKGGESRDGHGGDNVSNGYLFESTYVLAQRHTFFGRLERVKNDELFEEGDPLHGQGFNVSKLSLGYIRDFARFGDATLGIGGLLSAYRLPDELHDAYGAHPLSTMVFLRLKL